MDQKQMRTTMKTKHIKLGIARKSCIERYPAHIVKLSRRMLFEVWDVHTTRDVIFGGTLEEMVAWAKENGYELVATNCYGKSFIK